MHQCQLRLKTAISRHTEQMQKLLVPKTGCWNASFIWTYVGNWVFFIRTFPWSLRSYIFSSPTPFILTIISWIVILLKHQFSCSSTHTHTYTHMENTFCNFKHHGGILTVNNQFCTLQQHKTAVFKNKYKERAIQPSASSNLLQVQ